VKVRAEAAKQDDDDLAPIRPSRTSKKAKPEEKGFDMPERSSVRGPMEM
jgi:hypothetical protein